ncbi:hypothetical protein AB0L05_06630, partial [Nonomuraea pusilla]
AAGARRPPRVLLHDRPGHALARRGAGLLLEGVVLRLQADLRWLAACERAWSEVDDEVEGG